MSTVTDVILTLSLMDEDSGGVDALNAILSADGVGMLNQVDEYAGGAHKVMQAIVFMGAFNGLDVDGFIKAVDLMEWADRDGLALFVKREHDDRFTDVTPP